MYEQTKIFFVNVEIFFRTQILYSTDDGGPAAGAVAKQRGGGEQHGLGLAKIWLIYTLGPQCGEEICPILWASSKGAEKAGPSNTPYIILKYDVVLLNHEAYVE